MKTKYNWSNVPKEINWIATDEDGDIWGYIEKPKIYDKGWGHMKSGTFYFIGSNPLESKWKSSREERPNEE